MLPTSGRRGTPTRAMINRLRKHAGSFNGLWRPWGHPNRGEVKVRHLLSNLVSMAYSGRGGTPTSSGTPSTGWNGSVSMAYSGRGGTPTSVYTPSDGARIRVSMACSGRGGTPTWRAIRNSKYTWLVSMAYSGRGGTPTPEVLDEVYAWAAANGFQWPIAAVGAPQTGQKFPQFVKEY